MNIKPLISILIPCRNEGKFIGRCLDSIIVQNYPKEKLEVLIVDGMSEDETRKILKSYIQKLPYLKLQDNPKKITPTALNIGIEKSKGNFILRMDAHSECEKDYISKCLKYMKEFNADAVGGIIKTLPRNNTLTENLVCTALSHPFGVGKSFHKIGSKKPQWVDTAFGVCYKREIFKEVGFFNEKLARGQDMEFSLRLKKAGFKTLLVPEIVSRYYPRSNFFSFIKTSVINGIWAVLPFKYTSIMPVSWRHLIPLAFVSILIALGILSIFLQILVWPLLSAILLYSIFSIYFSFKIALKIKDIRYLFLMPIMFGLLHLGYGLGSLVGSVNVIVSKHFWKNRFIR